MQSRVTDTDDTAAFKAAYQAAAAGSVIYVPNGVTVLQPPPNWGVPDQAGEVDRRRHITAGWHAAGECNSRRRQPGKQLPAGIVVGNSGISVEVSQNGSQPDRFRGCPFVLHRQPHRRTNRRCGHRKHAQRHDHIQQSQQFRLGRRRQIAMVRLTNPERCPCRRACRALRADDPAECSAWIRLVRRCRSPISGPRASNTATSPASHRAWPASSITVEMDWFGNGPDDGNLRQIQSLVVGQHNTSGAPVEISDDHRRLPGRGMRRPGLSRCSASTSRSRHRSSTPPTPSRWLEPRPSEWPLVMRSPLSPPTSMSARLSTAPRTRCAGTRAALSYRGRQGHRGRARRPSMPAMRHCRTTCPATSSSWSAARPTRSHFRQRPPSRPGPDSRSPCSAWPM